MRFFSVISCVLLSSAAQAASTADKVIENEKSDHDNHASQAHALRGLSHDFLSKAMVENKQGPVSDSSMPLLFEEMESTLDTALAEESEEIKSIFKQSLGLLRKVVIEKPENGRLLIQELTTELASFQKTQSDALTASLNRSFDHIRKTIVKANDMDFQSLALGLESSISVLNSIVGNAAGELRHDDHRALADMNNEMMDASKAIHTDMIKGLSMAVEDDGSSMEALVSHIVIILEEHSKSAGAIAEYKRPGGDGGDVQGPGDDLPGFIGFPLCFLAVSLLAGPFALILVPFFLAWVVYGLLLIQKCDAFPDLAACDVLEDGGMWDEKAEMDFCIGF